VHERTQRAIARLLFVFCCAVPTAINLVCVVVTWTPWFHNRARTGIEQEIARETGLLIHIDDFRRYAPATIVLSGVQLFDPETLQEVGRVRQVQWDAEGDEVSIVLRQPELQSAELASTWRLIHDRFLCRPERTAVPVQLVANDLTIHSSGGSVTLRDVGAWIGLDEGSVRASLQCFPAGSTSHTPVTVTAARDRSLSEPTTRWLLDAGDTPLPCGALADYLPPLTRLGSEAEFRGRMRWYGDRREPTIDLAGARFDAVSLDRLFEDQTHRLSGRATIQFDRCRIDPAGRRRDIVGTIRATDGVIGRSLLISAATHLGFDADATLRGGGDPYGTVVRAGGQDPQLLAADNRSHADIPFDLLALQFDLNNSQLKLSGVCHNEVGYESLPEAVVICRDGFPLVRSSRSALDALAVVKTIAPQHSVMAPLAAQTHWLTEIFTPPSAPLPPSETRIRRLAERYDGEPEVRQPDPVGSEERGVRR